MLSLSEERFAAHLVQLLAEQPEMRCGELRVADLYLARACVDGEAGALAVFEASFWPAVDGTLQRVRLSREQREDVLQDLRVSLLLPRGAQPGRIAQYRGMGDLRRWLRAVALREAWRAGKTAHRELALDDAVLATVVVLDENPALARYKEVCRAELKKVFVAALETLRPEDRLVLRQYHLVGLTIDELARLYGIHRATAARRVGKARSLLTESVVAGLGERLQIRDRELASVLELVRSQLDLSLDRLLGASVIETDEQGDDASQGREP
jgi:RNA polymerase sigma-70 factor (ECF subfamily)